MVFERAALSHLSSNFPIPKAITCDRPSAASVTTAASIDTDRQSERLSAQPCSDSFEQIKPRWRTASDKCKDMRDATVEGTPCREFLHHSVCSP